MGWSAGSCSSPMDTAQEHKEGLPKHVLRRLEGQAHRFCKTPAQGMHGCLPACCMLGAPVADRHCSAASQPQLGSSCCKVPEHLNALVRVCVVAYPACSIPHKEAGLQICRALQCQSPAACQQHPGCLCSAQHAEHNQQPLWLWANTIAHLGPCRCRTPAQSGPTCPSRVF